MNKDMDEEPSRWQRVIAIPFILIIFLFFSPLFIIFGIVHFITGKRLGSKFRIKWGPEGKFILFVYSESPNWQEYIEENIIPKLEPNVVTLNWSRRSEWKENEPLEAKVLYHWGGDSEFNPLAVVFPKKGKVETIRFFKAFKDYKHGNSKLLKQQEDNLFQLVARLKSS
jgi:hypothetical protein